MTEVGAFVVVYVIFAVVSLVMCLCAYADERGSAEGRTFWARQAMLSPLWPVQVLWVTLRALRATAPDFVKAVIGRRD